MSGDRQDSRDARLPRRRRILRIGLPIVVLVAALLVAGYLRATKPRLTPTEPEERTWLISAVEAQVRDQQPDLVAYGEVVTQRDVEMRALVAGQVTAVGDAFVDGALVHAGDLLVQIDQFDFEQAVAEAKARLAEAKASLVEIEAQLDSERNGLQYDREQLDIADREVARRESLVRKKAASEKALDDARSARSERARAASARERTVEALKARSQRQSAIIQQVEVNLRRAQRDLENTRLVAPFDGLLTDTSAAIGKRLGVNDRVARLLDLGRLEAKFHLSDAEFGRLVASKEGLAGRHALILWRAGTRRFDFDGEVVRVSGEIDPASGGVVAYARIKNAGPGTALRPGAFVEVRVADRHFRDVVRLPETALHNDDTVYVVAGERLEARLVQLLLRVGNDVLVHGELAQGEQVAVTRFPEIGPGVKVKVR